MRARDSLLEGKVAIVTGGGQGIGRTIAIALADEGADVVVYDMNMATAKSVANEIKSIGRKALAVKCDVSQSAEVRKAVREVLDKFNKKIDILVNNAGVTILYPPEELPEHVWNKTIDTNLKGTFLCCQAVGREMIKQKSGKIVNISSLSGLFGGPSRAAYCSSKGGVILLTKSLAADWGKYNVNVNVVCPGYTETPRLSELKTKNPETYERRLKRIPLQRPNIPEDIAEVVVFLASHASDNIHGSVLIIDGGISSVHPGYA